jgi:hypothetical protein
VNVNRETTNRNQDPLNSATETRLGSGAQTPARKTADAADLLVGTGAETADSETVDVADLLVLGT